MARKVHQFNYDVEQLDDILRRADEQPFVIWHDEKAGVYRFFPDEARRDIWIEAYQNDALTPEIAKYQFVNPITAPAPYVINITFVSEDNKPVLYGTKNVTLDFTFSTVDSYGVEQPESVDVYYTFSSPSGTKTASGYYTAGTEVSMIIDDYLDVGANNITVLVRGRSTNAMKTAVIRFNVVKLELTSTFSIATPVSPTKILRVAYHIVGSYDKVIHFWIDGEQHITDSASSLETDTTKTKDLNIISPGKHTLQLYATMQVGSVLFRSNLLYYEFMVDGNENEIETVISEIFPNTQELIQGFNVTFNAEQYVEKVINWAYYSSNYNQAIATIVWRLYSEDNGETAITTRVTDAMQAESGIAPAPLRFMPTVSGVYKLQALIDNVIVAEYNIVIIPNTAGIAETVRGLTMRLSGLGRNNNEPDTTLSNWSNNGFSTTFNNVLWNNNCGWNNNALVLNNGATAVIDNKPFASEISPHANNGCAFEIDFETCNVDDDDAELVRIGDNNGPSLVITTNKAIFRSKFGTAVAISRFKSDERIKIAFVVYPQSDSDYNKLIFVYNNAVMSSVRPYESGDNFNIGSSEQTESPLGKIYLGNAEGKAGIKIYYIRTYNMYINMYDELNNFFIDSGSDLQRVVIDNDIYDNLRNIDIDKLKSTITTVELTGNLGSIIGPHISEKLEVSCELHVSSPGKSSINLNCDKACLRKAGQSTLDKPVPSFHVKLDKSGWGNVCYDRDGKIYPKNRWAFRAGNVPEKKFRLQANYMDSSCCHNGAFFRLFNEVAPKVSIEGSNVLQIPIQKYINRDYSDDMTRIHGENPNGTSWTFPYRINMVPDSIPCIVIWRPDSNSPYSFLGQYVIMEEKKANYANGMHSIYSMIDSEGNPDPFGFVKEKEGERLWDNVGCHQMELLRSTTNMSLFLDDSEWNTINSETGSRVREETFELIYPDEDDLTDDEIAAEWNKFYNDIVHPIVSTVGNQSAFKQLIYGPNPKIDRWHLAAYYCLAMRNACTDSMVRNMEFVTYDGNIWLPKWWDVDMQCGLQQTGQCNIEPCSDRDTPSPSSSTEETFAFSGRMTAGNTIVSSWFWDALTGNKYMSPALKALSEFMDDVKKMDAALYNAGWTYNSITSLQDEMYVDAWSKALYNESSVYKYLNYVDYESLQGDRTPHRHWFLRTSYDYFDALNGCGEYFEKVISIRTQISTTDRYVKFRAAKTSYFGWRITTTPKLTGYKVEKGQLGQMHIYETTNLNDPLGLYSSNKMEMLDLRELGEYLKGSDFNFAGSYDTVLGSMLKEVYLGCSMESMHENHIFNTSSSLTGIQRKVKADDVVEYPVFHKLELCDIRGLQFFKSFDMWDMENLKEFYAAGSGLISFNPKEGTRFTALELPTSVVNLQFDRCNLTGNDNHCLIQWYNTIYHDDIPYDVELVSTPSTIREISCTGMGSDLGAKELVLNWVNAIDALPNSTEIFESRVLTFRNIAWDNVTVADVIRLGKIGTKTLTGTINCVGQLDDASVRELLQYYPATVFDQNTGNAFRINFASSFFLVSYPSSEVLSGNSITPTTISFPNDSAPVTYQLGLRDGFGNFVENSIPLQNGVYNYYNITMSPSTGTIQSDENETDRIVMVRAIKGNEHTDTTIIIRGRTYPTGVDYTVSFNQGADAIYNPSNDSYFVSSDNTTVTLVAQLTPSTGVNGTCLSRNWSIDENLRAVISSVQQTDTTLSFTIPDITTTLVSGMITYVTQYLGNGHTYAKGKMFNLKELTVAVRGTVNAPLQAYIYGAGLCYNEDRTYDTEALEITDLSFALGTNGNNSNLVHLAEINSFINLDMTTLDLRYCNLLGSNSSTIQLEDGRTTTVTILPSAIDTLAIPFEEIYMLGTQLQGVNLPSSGSTLETITYSNYTTTVDIQNQSALQTVSIPIASAGTINRIEIKNCNNLTNITWI